MSQILIGPVINLLIDRLIDIVMRYGTSLSSLEIAKEFLFDPISDVDFSHSIFKH